MRAIGVAAPDAATTLVAASNDIEAAGDATTAPIRAIASDAAHYCSYCCLYCCYSLLAGGCWLLAAGCGCRLRLPLLLVVAVVPLLSVALR